MDLWIVVSCGEGGEGNCGREEWGREGGGIGPKLGKKKKQIRGSTCRGANQKKNKLGLGTPEPGSHESESTGDYTPSKAYGRHRKRKEKKTGKGGQTSSN